MPMFGKHKVWVAVLYGFGAGILSMNIIQLLITGVAIVGIIVIGLVAIVPSLIDYPRGRDQDESDPPAPTPVKPDDHHDSIDLAA
jgi:hypothetical protein